MYCSNIIKYYAALHYIKTKIQTEPNKLNYVIYLIGQLLSNCPSSHFQCENKRCIDPLMMCDRKNDCLDGSDETLGCEGM